MPTTATYTRPFHLTTSEYSTFGPSLNGERITQQKSSKPLIIKKTENLRPFTYFAYTTNDSVENISDFCVSDTSSEDESIGKSKMHVFERIKALLESLGLGFKYLRKLTMWAATPHTPRRPSA